MQARYQATLRPEQKEWSTSPTASPMASPFVGAKSQVRVRVGRELARARYAGGRRTSARERAAYGGIDWQRIGLS